MVIGIGIDSVQISEIDALISGSEGSFEMATFSEDERRAAHASLNPAERFAGLFAAKEAVFKALAPSVPELDFDLRRVHLGHREDGSPYVVIDGYLSRIMEQARAGSVLISITNEGDLATAVALAQSEAL